MVADPCFCGNCSLYNSFLIQHFQKSNGGDLCPEIEKHLKVSIKKRIFATNQNKFIMKKLTFLAGIAFVLFSCNSGNKEPSTTDSDGNTETSSRVKGKSYNCSNEFQDDYSKLLTKEDMLAVYPFDIEAAKIDSGTGEYGRHIYSWPSDRPDVEQEIGGMKMKGSDMNTMGVALLSFYNEKSDMQSTRELFDRAYKKLSDKELKEINDNLNKQDEKTKETGKDLMEVRKKSAWEFVDGVGNSAWYKWNERWGGEMAVLAGKSKFYIRLKISADPAENLEIAKKLAEKVLEKCN